MQHWALYRQVGPALRNQRSPTKAEVLGRLSLASLAALVELHYRSSPLLSFATNRENMVAGSGHPQHYYSRDPIHLEKKPIHLRVGQWHPRSRLRRTQLCPLQSIKVSKGRSAIPPTWLFALVSSTPHERFTEKLRRLSTGLAFLSDYCAFDNPPRNSPRRRTRIRRRAVSRRGRRTRAR